MKQGPLLTNSLFLNQAKNDLKNGSIGIEKESFRLWGEGISPRKHPETLGAALTNKFITTDFGESLLEFVTKPESNNKHLMDFLDHIHYFFYTKVSDEILWPFSFPPEIVDESEIKIAEYGNSNTATLKRLYRKGLSARYGRLMQSISGLHFNYSLNPSILELIINEYNYKKGLTRSDVYLAGVRNLTRLNWFLIYLFGSSPFVTKNFSVVGESEFNEINGVFLNRESTSLRMSDIGYSVPAQHKFKISLNTLNEYIDSVSKYINLNNPEFDFQGKHAKPINQISSSYLQTEDELYAAARPKSNSTITNRTLFNLSNGGIDYIELRSLDINPFKTSGIDQKDVNFLEAFVIFCLLDDSPYMSEQELNTCRENDQLVSKYGRKSETTIKKNANRVSIQEWGLEIFQRMEPIFDLVEIEEKDKISFQRRLMDISSLPSSMVEEMIMEDNFNIKHSPIEIAEKNKYYFLNHFKKDAKIIETLEDEAKRSIKESKDRESNKEIPFDEFLRNYLGELKND